MAYSVMTLNDASEHLDQYCSALTNPSIKPDDESVDSMLSALVQTHFQRSCQNTFLNLCGAVLATWDQWIAEQARELST